MIFDNELEIKRGPETVYVYLNRGGENYPWTSVGNKIVVGPLRKSTVHGVPTKDLKWNTNKYWVCGAKTDKGQWIELTPREYERCVSILETWERLSH